MNFFDSMTSGVSIPLTKLASGFRDANLINEQVFPVVTALVSSGTIPIANDDMLKIYETVRARLAKSNRALIGADSWLTYACQEHDLAMPMDKQELDELKNIPGDLTLKAFFDIQNRTRLRVQHNMALKKEKTVADMVFTASNYTNGNTVSLTTTDCWSETGSTPIQDIETGMIKVRDLIGIKPNTIVFGSTAWDTLKFHAQYQNIMKLTVDQIVTTDFIKFVHGFKNVYVGEAKYKTDAGAKADVWGDDVLLCYIPPTITPDLNEPSFGYTIRPQYSATPYPYVDIFDEEGGKIINVRCTDKYTQKLIMADAGYLIKNVKK